MKNQFDEILRYTYLNGLTDSLEKYFPGIKAENTPRGVFTNKCLSPISQLKIDKWTFDNHHYLSTQGKLAPDFCRFIDQYKRIQNHLLKTKVNELPEINPIIQKAKDKWTKEGVSPIFILYYKYNYFSPADTAELPKLVGQNQIKQTIDLSEDIIFEVCIFSTNNQSSNKINFVVDPDFIFSNCQEEINEFQLDLNDGKGLQKIELEKEYQFEVNYKTPGKKVLSAHIFDKNTIHSKIFFVENNTPSLTSTKTSLKTQASKVVFMTAPGQGGGKITYNPIDKLAKEFGFNTSFTAGETYKGSDHSIGEVADDIIRVIKKVNTEKPDHRLVLLGYSMGGLTTQYAISKLLNEGYDPKIEAYISLDGPIRGVNVPLAYQYFLTQVPESYLSAAAKEDKRNLFKKGAIEMIRYYHYGANDTLKGPDVDYVNARPHATHIALMEKLSEMKKHPEWHNIIKIGFASGSKDKQYTNDDLFFHFEKSCFGHFGNLQIYRVGNKSKKLLFSENSENLPQGDLRLHAQAIALDRAPGCLSDVPKKVNRGLIEAFNNNVPKFKERNDIKANIKHCCYIPTVSALDIDTDDPFFTVNKSMEEIKKASWFDLITLNESNSPHIPKTLGEDQVKIIRKAFTTIAQRNK